MFDYQMVLGQVSWTSAIEILGPECSQDIDDFSGQYWDTAFGSKPQGHKVKATATGWLISALVEAISFPNSDF